MFRIAKRLIDLILSVALIVISFPLQILFAILLWIEIKENPIFRQERAVSYDHQRFHVLKFRTIKSDLAGSIVPEKNVQKFLIRNIKFRITPVARWMRKTGLDELLQIYNVLIGHMSFVGPRPLMIDELIVIKNNFYEYHCMRAKIKSLPGITGVWQVNGDRNLGIDNLIRLDLLYEKNKSLYLDLKILFSTLLMVMLAKNSDSMISGINQADEIVSASQHEFLAADNENKIKSYVFSVPDDLQYTKDSYASRETAGKKKIKVFEKETILKKLLQ